MTALIDSAPKGAVPFDLGKAPSLTNSIPYALQPLQKDRPSLLRIRGWDYRLSKSCGDVSRLPIRVHHVPFDCLLYLAVSVRQGRGGGDDPLSVFGRK